jgi:hypothetical protein
MNTKIHRKLMGMKEVLDGLATGYGYGLGHPGVVSWMYVVCTPQQAGPPVSLVQ